MTEQKEVDFLEEVINDIRNNKSLKEIKTKLIIRKHDVKEQFSLHGVVASNCRHCDNKLCDAQRFNNVCFECGKKPV
jgi:hypothetical protein